MDFEIHSEALEEFLDLPEKDRKIVRNAIESRRGRENPITEQRGTGISYDSRGEPLHYFKVEQDTTSYRVFFDIDEGRVILVGVRHRDEDTYLNLREYTNRLDG